MASFQEILVRGIIKDFKNIQEMTENKTLRKECSLLIKRVKSAKLLLSKKKEDVDKLEKLEKEIQEFKDKR